MSAPSELDPATLNREIARLETDIARLDLERAALASSIRLYTHRLHYLRLARWFRSPRQSFPLYPFAVFAIGPLVTGVLVFVALTLLFSKWSLGLGGFLTGVFVGAAVLASLLHRPPDELLPATFAETEAQRSADSARLAEYVAAIGAMNKQLAFLLEQRRDLATSDKLQRAMLLQRDWKSLRGGEWEDYVVEVCRTLGANVQRGPILDDIGRIPKSPATGPRGIIRHPPTTLFVTFSPRRIAIAAVSEINPFHTAAVQQTVHALAQHGCDALGIITNSRLTAGSNELARSRRCTLIGEEEFPDFVLGKIAL